MSTFTIYAVHQYPKMDNISNWLTANKLTLSVNKTEYVLLRSNKKNTATVIMIVFIL